MPLQQIGPPPHNQSASTITPGTFQVGNYSFAGSTIADANIDTFTLTGGAQDVVFTGQTNDLLITGGTASTDFVVEIAALDNDGTDSVGLEIDSVGILSGSNREGLFVGWDAPGGRFELRAEAAGTGSVRALALETSGNADQVVLNTNGTTTVSSLIATTADINGGTIDGVSIGASSAATIANIDNLRLDGNTISSTNTNGDITLDPDGSGNVSISGAELICDKSGTFGDGTAGVAVNVDGIVSGGRNFVFKTAGALRLVFGADSNPETGSNAGSNFFIDTYSDGGAYVGTPLTVSRASGAFTMRGPVTITSGNTLTVSDTTASTGTGSGSVTAAGGVGIAGRTSTNNLAVVDGITAPATEAGYAVIYVDSADGDLKVKFGDGTVKTLATDT